MTKSNSVGARSRRRVKTMKMVAYRVLDDSTDRTV